MPQKKKRKSPEVDAASMADIAFLLLIFFLVATTFPSDKGISMTLPPKPEDKKVDKEVKQRNVYNILINSSGMLLVEDQPMDPRNLTKAVQKFLTNNGVDENLSESPKKAVVSLKGDRGTTFEVYINVLDKVQAAYHNVRAKELGWTTQEYIDFDLGVAKEKGQDDIIRKIGLVKEKYPMRISEADPNKKN